MRVLGGLCSAVFVQLTAECPYVLQWIASFSKNCPFVWEYMDPIQYMVLSTVWARPSPHPKRDLDRFGRIYTELTIVTGIPTNTETTLLGL